jgi:hypothetical protein
MHRGASVAKVPDHFVGTVIFPEEFDVGHGRDNTLLVDLANGHNLLVLGERTGRVPIDGAFVFLAGKIVSENTYTDLRKAM